VLAGHVEDALGANSLQHFVRRVELLGLRELRDIAGVNDERRVLWECVELRDGFLKRRGHVLVRFLVEADVTVADLCEEDALSLIRRE